MKYRIVKYGVFYEAEVRRWWWPFWMVLGDDYSFQTSLSEARALIDRHKERPRLVVVYEDETA